MAKPTRKIKIAAVIGSVREDNMTSKALAVALDELKRHRHVTVSVIDPAKARLWGDSEKNKAAASRIQQLVSQSAGVILATPEYHGSYSSSIKLVIDNLGYPSALAGKPVALLGVATGQIGAIKALEHLRSVCAHIGSVVLPKVVSIARIDKLFDSHGRCLDAKTEERIHSLARGLLEYIRNQALPVTAMEENVRGD